MCIKVSLKISMEQASWLTLALARARDAYRKDPQPMIPDNRDEILAQLQMAVAEAISKSWSVYE